VEQGKAAKKVSSAFSDEIRSRLGGKTITLCYQCGTCASSCPVAKLSPRFNPREVIKLMVEMLDPKPSESVYDPCCGSGGMLIISYLHVAEKYGEEETRRLFL